jgi:hypothetical protein
MALINQHSMSLKLGYGRFNELHALIIASASINFPDGKIKASVSFE